MTLSLDTTVRQALERIACDDPDYQDLSPALMQALYDKSTLRDVVGHVQTRLLVTCANAHDDPCSGVSLNSCPLREINVACGHQDRIGAFHASAVGVRTPGSAMVTLCDALIADGAAGASDLRGKVTALIKKLSENDAAAFIGYRKLRQREEDFEDSPLPHTSFRNPLASPLSLAAHKDAIVEEQHRLGQEMLALRDEIFTLLETRVGESLLQDASIMTAS